VEIVHGTFPVDGHEFAGGFLGSVFDRCKFGLVFIDLFEVGSGKVSPDGIRDDKISISQPLHKCAGAQAIGTVI